MPTPSPTLLTGRQEKLREAGAAEVQAKAIEARAELQAERVEARLHEAEVRAVTAAQLAQTVGWREWAGLGARAGGRP